jgi:hypothetical protein
VHINVHKTHFLHRYIQPGKVAVCGFYSSYNNHFYMEDGRYKADINPDYLYEALGTCIDSIVFDNSPRPYAMLEFDVKIESVDYETNTITCSTDGATIIITTNNSEIDRLYNKFYKVDRLGAVYTHIILKNWHYTAESEDSFADNTVGLRRKTHFRKTKAKNDDILLNDVEYQEPDRDIKKKMDAGR